MIARRNQKERIAMKSQHCVLVAVLALVSSLADGVGAADPRVSSGTICRPFQHVEHWRYGIDSRIINTSATDSLQVHCPLLRDNVGDGVVGSARVTVVNANFPGLDCFVLGMDDDSDALQFQSVVTNVASPNLQELRFTGLIGQPSWSLDMICTLPRSTATGSSSLKNIRWERP
jgi:hypothetical protein